MNAKTKAWVNIVLLIVTLGVNAAGAMGLINGLSQKEVSDMYNTVITPAPFTFRIWSVIYILLIVSLIVMIIKKDDDYYKNAVERISVPFWISCILNIGWIVFFSYEMIGISTIFILGFMYTLLFIMMRLEGIYKGERQLLRLTFGLYGGWLTVASIVNEAAFFTKRSGAGYVTDSAGATILILGIIIVRIIMFLIRNAFYPLPVAWAYYGIYSTAIESGNSAVANVSVIGIIILVFLFMFMRYKNRRKWR